MGAQIKQTNPCHSLPQGLHAAAVWCACLGSNKRYWNVCMVLYVLVSSSIRQRRLCAPNATSDAPQWCRSLCQM